MTGPRTGRGDPSKRDRPRSPRRSRASAVVAILLAAGRSTRMGSPKLLLRVAGKPLLEHALESLEASRVGQIVVVLGHEARRIRNEVSFGEALVVENPRYVEGLSTSIREGLRAADPSATAYLFALADQPFVSHETINTILRRWEDDGASIVIPTFRGHRGNPVLIDRRLASHIERVTGDVGFRALFDAHAGEIREVAVDDPGVRFDVDTPGPLESLTSRLGRGHPLRQVLADLVADGDPPGE